LTLNTKPKHCSILLDLAPGPIETRKKRLKLTPEDELIRLDQESKFAVENRKLDLEEQKLALEREKLFIESKREDRLADEARRRDELNSTQLKLQSDMYELMKLMMSNSSTNK